ncbi:pyridoxine 5'-phosphate synthase [Granulibacter bethesdensis]|uniref:pyridoxine 5'-phosphate synthase n=1 Tax=Granulibacter bethesdensis TaxID=364410 RepID=UPI00090B6248|nr:pyridoxine 5'-phosphate synthase [Granulibacter bethesdensis]APH60402.1 Pyridoxal phosphate biosynthetic protein pdxJ [Granulibacter bethesdensis]
MPDTDPGSHTLRLGVNIDHVATIRNARGGTEPDPVRAALLALEAGADGITMHLREDRRHIRDADLTQVMAAIRAPLNLEMAATEEMVGIARHLRPHACCLVPERREEVTTEGGLDAAGHIVSLMPKIAALREAGIRVSLFIDPDPRQLRAAVALGAPVVELHTGAYALEADASHELSRLQEAASMARDLGLECHAGHGLTVANVTPVAQLPGVRELNIGHALIAEAVFAGLGQAIRDMRLAMDRAIAA